MFKKLRQTIAKSRLSEEILYKKALYEYEVEEVRPGLWGKALADSYGDESKAKGLYLRYRVQAMLDEDELVRAAMESSNFENMKEQKSKQKALIAEEKERERKLKKVARAAGAKYTKT